MRQLTAQRDMNYFKESGDAEVGWRIFSFGGQGVWNGIDFTAKAELIDQLEST